MNCFAFVMVIIGNGIVVHAQETARHILPAFSFYGDKGEDIEHWKSLDGLTTNGESIFINSRDEAIIEVDQGGYLVRKIGRLGHGPGEYDLRHAMAAVGDHLWVMTPSHMLHYEEGIFLSEFRLGANPRALQSISLVPGAKHFDLVGNQMMLPLGVDGRPGQIATLFSTNGAIRKKIHDKGFDKKKLYLSPWAQMTMWQFHEGVWYGAYAYLPRVVTYDRNGKQGQGFEIESRPIKKYLERFHDRTIEPKRKNIPLFFGFQIFEGDLFLSASMELHRIAPSGRLKALYRFKPMDEPEVQPPRPISLPNFAILDSRSIILGNQYMGGRLFIAKLPED